MAKEKLKRKAQDLKLLPGVYFMEDTLGNIIYIGKSKALKNRVSSYFGGSQKPSKVERMVRSINDFKVQYTDTELEALILECQLIKAHKPIYNRLLKQDHKYRYLYLNQEEERPRIKLVREQTEEGIYFGPYEKGQTLYRLVQAVNSFYQLPDCSWQEIKANCLSYKRGKCIGPCSRPYNEGKLKENLQQVQEFLQGQNDEIITFYEKKMEEAANKLAFEEAMAYKEMWQGLKSLHFKREALQFAISPNISILRENCPAGGRKLFIWRGTKLIDSYKIEEKIDRRKQQLALELSKKACESEPVLSLKKEEIDEAQIIYSWIQKQSDENYVCLMTADDEVNQTQLEKVLEQLMA